MVLAGEAQFCTRLGGREGEREGGRDAGRELTPDQLWVLNTD